MSYPDEYYDKDGHEPLYDGVNEYHDEIADRLETIINHMVTFETRLDEIIFNKGYDGDRPYMLTAEEVVEEALNFNEKYYKILGDLVNLQKEVL